MLHFQLSPLYARLLISALSGYYFGSSDPLFMLRSWLSPGSFQHALDATLVACQHALDVTLLTPTRSWCCALSFLCEHSGKLLMLRSQFSLLLMLASWLAHGIRKPSWCSAPTILLEHSIALLTPHCWNFERALGATLSTPAHFWCHALSPLLEHSSMLLMLPSWLPLGTFQHALFATLWAFSWNIPAGFASSLPLLFRDLRTLGSAIVCYDWLDMIGPWRKRDK